MRSVTPGCSSRAGGGRAPGSSSPPRPRDRFPPAAGAPGHSNSTPGFSASDTSGAMQPTRRRLRLADVNDHIVCFLCRGYYVDATTVVECLHSFCKSCILRYLENNSFCPICDVQIQSDAERHLRRDKVLQSLVYKMVPDLYREEMKRRRDFYAQNPRLAPRARPEERGAALDPMIFSPTEPFSLALQYYEGGGESESEAGSSRGESAGPSSPATLADTETSSSSYNCHPPGSSSLATTTTTSGLPKRYLQCQAQVPVTVIKKFLRLKYELAPWLTVELRHKKEVLTDDLTLMDVAYIYTWKRNDPLLLQYRFNDSRLVSAAAPSPNVTEANGVSAAVASASQSPAQTGTNTKEHTKDAAQTEGHASEKTKTETKGEIATADATMASEAKDTATSSTNTKERACAKDASRSAEETERGAAPTPTATHPDPNLVKEPVASDSSKESTKVEGKPSASATKDDSKDEPKDSSASGGGGRRRQQQERVNETWISSGDSSPTASSSGSTASSPSASPSSSRSSSPSGRRTARLAMGRGGTGFGPTGGRKRGRGRWTPTAALAALAAKRAATGDSAFTAAKKQAAEESPTEASPSPTVSPVPSSPPPTLTSDIVSSSSTPPTTDPPQPPPLTDTNVAAVPPSVTLLACEEKRPAVLVTSRKRPSESSGVGPEEKRTRRVPPLPALVTILPVSASAVVAARRRLAQGPTSQTPPRQTQSPLPSPAPQQQPSLGNASKESGGGANTSVPDSSSPASTPSTAPPTTTATTASVSSQTPAAARVVKRELSGGKSPRREGVRSPPPAQLPSPKRLRSYSHYPLPSSAPATPPPTPVPVPVKTPTVSAAQTIQEVHKSSAGARPPLVRTLDGFRSPPPNSSERARASVEAVTRTSEESSSHAKNSSAASVKTLAARDGDSGTTAAQGATSKVHVVSEATNDSSVKKATNESSKQETDTTLKSTLTTSSNVSAAPKSDNKPHSSAENKPGVLSCERENNVCSEGEKKQGNSLAPNANESKDSRMTPQPDSKKQVSKVNQTTKDTGETDKKPEITFKDEKKPAAVSKDARPLQSGKTNESKSCSVPSSKISDNNPLAITFRLPPGSTIEPVAAGSGRRSSVATAKDTLTVRPHPGNQSSKSSGSSSAGSSTKNPIRPAQNTIAQRLSTSSSSPGASGDPKKPVATTNDNKKPVGSQQVPKDPARPLKMDMAGSRSPMSPSSPLNNPVRSPAGAPPSPAPHRSPSQAPPRPPTPASRPSPASTPNSLWQSNKESRSPAGTNGPVRAPTSTSATPAAESAPTPARPSSASATAGSERRPGTPARPTAAPSPAPPAAHRPLSRGGQNGARPEDEAPPSSPGAVKSPTGVGPGPYARMTAPTRDSPAQSTAKVTFIPRLLQTPQPPPGSEEGARRPRGTNTAVRGRRRVGTGVLDLSSSATRPVPPRAQGIASIAQNLARRHLLNAAAAAAAAQRPTEAPLAHARPAPASSPAPPRSPAPPPRSPLPPPRSPLSSLSAFSMGFPRSPSPQGSPRPRQAPPPASLPSDLAAAARLDQGAAPALLQHRLEWAAAAAAAAAAAGRGGEQLQRCLESLGVPNAAAASPFLQFAAAAAASSGGHPGGGGGGGGGGAGRGAGAFRK